MKILFCAALVGVSFFADYGQAKTVSCVTEYEDGEFQLETFKGNSKAKIYKSYWGDQLANMYVLTDSKSDDSKIIETYTLAYTVYSSGSSKTFKLAYKSLDPNSEAFEVVHWGKTYRCE
jgi:hypothetical protein